MAECDPLPPAQATGPVPAPGVTVDGIEVENLDIATDAWVEACVDGAPGAVFITEAGEAVRYVDSAGAVTEGAPTAWSPGGCPATEVIVGAKECVIVDGLPVQARPVFTVEAGVIAGQAWIDAVDGALITGDITVPSGPTVIPNI